MSSIQFTKNKKYAGQHPYFNSGESLGLGGVWVDVIEDVDENKKEGNQKRHSRKKICVFCYSYINYIFSEHLFCILMSDDYVIAIQYIVLHYLPGTMSGGIRKDIQETTTNKPSKYNNTISPVCKL